MRNLRRYPRRILPGCRADCFALRMFRDPVVVATNVPMRNLSLSGVSLIGMKPVRRGTNLRIQILGYREMPSFGVSGRVCWVEQRVNDSRRSIFLTGVEFTYVSPTAKKCLEYMMEHNGSRRPSTGSLRVAGTDKHPSTRLMTAYA